MCTWIVSECVPSSALQRSQLPQPGWLRDSHGFLNTAVLLSRRNLDSAWPNFKGRREQHRPIPGTLQLKDFSPSWPIVPPWPLQSPVQHLHGSKLHPCTLAEARSCVTLSRAVSSAQLWPAAPSVVPVLDFTQLLLPTRTFPFLFQFLSSKRTVSGHHSYARLSWSALSFPPY